MTRYSRHISLKEIGVAGQQKINDAKVLVIGAGGLGCPVLQYLTAAGIGTLGIVDDDAIDESNLQRQILFDTASVGQNKAIAAKRRLCQLNPTITIRVYPEKLVSDNVIRICKDYDVIVDGTDNFPTRYLINDAAIVLDKPLVYGAIYKFEGQVSVFNYKRGPSYRCLFPDPPKKGTTPNCSEVGVLGVLPGIIGTLQANEVLKLILDIGHPLSGKVYCFNVLTNQSSTIDIKKSKNEIEKIKKRGLNFEVITAPSSCATTAFEIDIEAIMPDEQIQFLDVRMLSEMPRVEWEDVLEIPLPVLSQNIDRISSNKKVIVFCRSGIRSRQAVVLLKEHNIVNCWSLKGGVSALAKAKLKMT